MEAEGNQCGFIGCGNSAVGSAAVRGTVWFASHSRLSPANGEEPHWELGGYIEPLGLIMNIHVCEDHNIMQEVVN